MILKKTKTNKKNSTPIGENFVVRPVKRGDAKSIWEIRNHPASRAVSHQTQEISLASHKKWFAQKYFSGRDNYCFVLADKELVAGYCRFDWDIEKNGYIVSIALTPDYQGRGLGGWFLAAVLKKMPTDKNILAEVLSRNDNSAKLFEKNNFKIYRKGRGWIYYKYVGVGSRVVGGKKKVILICFYDKICLSLKALSAKLKEAGHEVHIIYFKDDRAIAIDKFKKNSIQYQMLWLDQFWGCGQDVNVISGKEWQLLTSLVAKIKPDIIGVSVRSVHKKLAKQAAKKLRRVAPRATFLVGGYGPMLELKDYLKDFDYACVGEGDDVIVPFVEAANPEKIPNIAYLKNGQVIFNKILLPTDLDKLPFPDWHFDNKYLIDNNEIKTGNSFYDSQTYIIFCGRGCPSSCTYCMACHWQSMLKPYDTNFPKFRVCSPERAIKELLYAKKHFNIKYAILKDDIFGLDERWLFKFVALYDKKIGLEFSCLLDERFTTEKKLKRLYQSGLRKTVVGIQSANEEIRRRVFTRYISDDRVVAYARMLEKHDLQIRYDIIGWNSFENRQTLRAGMDFLKRLPKSFDTCAFELKMFPGSDILKKFQAEKPKPLPRDEYTFWAVIHQMVLFSPETEKIAFDLVEKPPYNAKKALRLFRRKIQERSAKMKIIAINDIEKNCRIMNDRVALKETKEPGITSSEMNRLMSGMSAKKFIKQGTILKWEYLQSSYGGIRGRGINK